MRLVCAQDVDRNTYPARFTLFPLSSEELFSSTLMRATYSWRNTELAMNSRIDQYIQMDFTECFRNFEASSGSIARWFIDFVVHKPTGQGRLTAS